MNLGKIPHLMKFDSKGAWVKDPRILLSCFLLSFAVFFVAGIASLTIARDPKNAVLLGFSALRILLFLITLGFGIFIGGIGFAAYKKGHSFGTFFALKVEGPWQYYLIQMIVLLALLWGWIALFFSSYLFGRWIYTFERLQPFGIALGLSALLFLIIGLVVRRQGVPVHALIKENKGALRSLAIILAFFAACTLLIATTHLGIKPDSLFWNVPGVPLSGPQFFGLLLLLAMGTFLLANYLKRFAWLRSVKVDLLLFGLIYLATLMVWSNTPMPRHPDILIPAAPAYQPYPFSDARVHDSGGLAILQGYGINFKGYTDKPLYMLLLAGLHIFAGQDYQRLVLLQVAFFALIPAVLFWLGKFFHSRTLGIFIALVTLLRQQNAIELSHQIDSSNAKLLLTEVPVFLGLALFTLFLFLWLRDPKPKPWLALLAGGMLGIASLIRLNPLMLFPFAVLLALLKLRPFSVCVKSILFFSLGLSIMILPWVFSGVDPSGRPWLLVKFEDVINVRYKPQSSLDVVQQHKQQTEPVFAEMAAQGKLVALPVAYSVESVKAFQSAGTDYTQFPYFIINHALHNLVGSVLALPDSLFYEDLRHLSQREYWQYYNNWQGELPPVQKGLIVVNLVLVAAGIAYGWVCYRWAGLAPLMVFLTYILALGFARNSGARYIIPIDWVPFLYYGLGLILLLNVLRKWVLAERLIKGLDYPAAAPAGSERKRLLFASLVLIFLGSLIPMANLVVPNLASTKSAQAVEQQMLELVPASLSKTGEPVAGKVLYPYLNENNDFEFSLMTRNGTIPVMIDREALKRDLGAGEEVVVGFQSGSQPAQPKYVLARDEAVLQLLWGPLP